MVVRELYKSCVRVVRVSRECTFASNSRRTVQRRGARGGVVAVAVAVAAVAAVAAVVVAISKGVVCVPDMLLLGRLNGGAQHIDTLTH